MFMLLFLSKLIFFLEFLRVLKMSHLRDLMKTFGVWDTVIEVFLDHSDQWLSPIIAAVIIFQEMPPISIEDIKQTRVSSVKTRALCWGN